MRLTNPPFPFNETDTAIDRAVQRYEEFINQNPNATPADLFGRFTDYDLCRVLYAYTQLLKQQELNNYDLCEEQPTTLLIAA